jgi:hypothetical protein
MCPNLPSDLASVRAQCARICPDLPEGAFVDGEIAGAKRTQFVSMTYERPIARDRAVTGPA